MATASLSEMVNGFRVEQGADRGWRVFNAGQRRAGPYSARVDAVAAAQAFVPGSTSHRRMSVRSVRNEREAECQLFGRRNVLS